MSTESNSAVTSVLAAITINLSVTSPESFPRSCGRACSVCFTAVLVEIEVGLVQLRVEHRLGSRRL